MSRRIRSLWQMVARDTAKRSPRSYPLRVERLEDRFVLSGGYLQTNLVSDIPHLAQHTDPNLHNPWGISVGPDGHVRVADNGTGLSTLYTEDGTALSQVVTIPPPAHSPSGTTAAPTGIVLNSTSDFVISAHHRSRPSIFIFAAEDGTLSGWNPEINGSNAILTVDNSGSGAVYKGLALGSNAQGNFLFATNFHAGTIDVFDKHFNQVHLAGSFVDPALPPPPIGSPGFAPFGIQNVGGKLFVTYALQKPGQHDDLAGPGNGFVDVFDTTGHLVTRFASHGTLDSPPEARGQRSAWGWCCPRQFREGSLCRFAASLRRSAEPSRPEPERRVGRPYLWDRRTNGSELRIPADGRRVRWGS